MRLTLKLTLAILIGVLLLLAAYGRAELDRQVAQFDADVRVHHQQLGRTLAAATATAWRTGGAAEAFALIESADAQQQEVRIRWVSLDGWAGENAPPFEIPGDVLRALADGRILSVSPPTSMPKDRLYTYVPIPLAAPMTGAIEISESLERHHAFAKVTVERTVTTLALTALVCGAVALAMGGLMVGRPVEKLIAMADRISHGQLDARVSLRQRDELGALAVALNGMAARLARSQTRLLEEKTERLSTLDQLRHADRLSTVGKLASGLAHELGTPLNVVSGHARLIADGEVKDDEARETAAVIHERAAAMTGIIRQLMDFARRRPPARSPVELAELCQRTVAMLRPLADKRRVTLTFVPSSEVTASVDEAQVGQALANLVVNALQASKAGGSVRVALTRAAGAGRREAPASGGGLAGISVSDDGPGIPEESLPHLFEPFFTTKPVGEGSGLGLSVSEGIVREHGGFISVDSAPGKGSTFTIHLPVEPEVHTEVQPEVHDDARDAPGQLRH